MERVGLKKELFRYIKLYWGLFICAMGVMILLKSDMGIPAWDVLNQGISKITGEMITIGQASIIIGILIVLVDVVLGQPIGMGTIINFIFVGVYMDIILYLDFIPTPTNLYFQIIELIVGIFFYTYGTYLYMIQELGCGPRDGFMQILTSRLNKPVSFIKNITEVIVLILGWFLGGKIGVATILNAFLMGFLLEKMFKLGKVDLRKLQHRSLATEMRLLKNYIRGKI